MTHVTPGPGKVLIASPTMETGARLGSLLRRDGWLTTEMHDGLSALEALRDGAADVAVLELLLPRMNALEIIQHLSRLPDPAPIVLVGAVDAQAPQGAAAYLTLSNCDELLTMVVRGALEEPERRSVEAGPALHGARWSPKSHSGPAAAVGHALHQLLAVPAGLVRVLLGGLGASDPRHALADETLHTLDRCHWLSGWLLQVLEERPLRTEPTNLNDWVSNMLPVLREVVHGSIDLMIQLSPEPQWVLVDARQLELLLICLVLDPPPGSGLLRIETRAASAEEVHEGRSVVLHLRADAKLPGAVAELTLLQVANCGGLLQSRQLPEGGSCREVYLPGVLPVPSSGAHSPGRTILLVEDNERVRVLIREVLSQVGHRVFDTGDPREAEKLAENHLGLVDLLLTDVNLPGMNGPELYNRLARRAAGLRVLYLSGQAVEDLIEQGVIAREDPVLQKPFPPSALLTLVRAVLAEQPAPP
jgi:DNA-binding response OmpR family regulator